MNLEKLLEQHLQASAADMPPYPADVEAIKARGNRRRLMNRLVIATGVAAALVATIVLATSLLQGQPDVVDPAPPITVPEQVDGPAVGTTLNDVVVFYGDEGITLRAADGVERVIGSDRYYEPILSLISDGDGGLLFQHGLTPSSWPQGSVMRLAAGAAMPEVIIEGASDLETLLGMVDGGFAYAGYVFGDRQIFINIRIVAVDGSESRVALEETFRNSKISTDMIGARGNRIVIADFGECAKVRIYDLDGQQLISPTTLDCDLTLNDLALSPDGSQLLILGRRNDSNHILTINTADGSIIGSVDVGDVWAVAWSTAEEALVVGSDGTGAVRLDTGDFRLIDPKNNSRVAAIDTVVVADDATTGSGGAQLPCDVVASRTPDIDWMPEADQPVIDTWEQLRSLAQACEWEQLSDIAEQDQTNLSFGGPIRLARLWILDGTNGLDTKRSFLDVTSLAPARTTDGWVWPAVSWTNADADWQVLVNAGVLTDAEVVNMKEFGGYIGLRVGIADDGTWLFSIAGD